MPKAITSANFNAVKPAVFQKSILQWFDDFGRKQLPWQIQSSPYSVWISEIMLQQTQVDTVIPYFARFMKRFNCVEHLAQADHDEVMHYWSGLGYYARARNLHKAANQIIKLYKGQMPQDLQQLQSLSGIGRSTAGAIASLGFKQPAAILDGNVKRVLARCFRVAGWSGKSAILKQFWEITEFYTPTKHCDKYNQAMMDLGSMVCTRSKPKCNQCPLKRHCQAFAYQDIENFPTKKAAKVKPKKIIDMFWVTDENQKVLLIKRPPTGIWGGLWCLPTTAELSLPTEYSIEKLELKGEFKHEFTHFTMYANIYHASYPQLSRVMDDQTQTWYDTRQQQSLGLPSPIAKQLMLNQQD